MSSVADEPTLENTPAAAPTVQAPAAQGDAEQIGPYRLRRRLGQGGMGVVYLAVDADDREVAVKVLRPHIAYDETARARLKREVSTLQRVEHPGVAGILDHDLTGERPYLVTRYVPGEPLDRAVEERGPLTPQRWLQVAGCLAESLQAIHSAGVVHRDLKPGNVLLLDGRPVLIDFGIAQAADDLRLTATGLVIGTPGYLAPELIDGYAVTESADWWGWAATMTFALTGRKPFGRGPFEAVLHRVQTGQVDLDGVDPRLEPLLRAALSPRLQDRPTATDILDGLDRYAEGRPALAQTPRPPAALAAQTVVQTRVLPDPEPQPQVTPEMVAQLVPSLIPSMRDLHIGRAKKRTAPQSAAAAASAAAVVDGAAGSIAAGTPSALPGIAAAGTAVPGTAALNSAAYHSGLPATALPGTALPGAALPGGALPGTAALPGAGMAGSAVPGSGMQGTAAYRSANTGPAAYEPQGTAAYDHGRKGVPQRAGAEPARLQPTRTWTLFAVLLAIAGLAARYPMLAGLVAALLMVLGRAVDRGSTALMRRRQARGGKGRTDGLIATVASPVHLATAALVTLPCLIAPLLMALTVGGMTALGLGLTQGFRWEPMAPLAVATGAMTGMLVAWWGPGGSSLRRGSRIVVRSTLRMSWLNAIVVTALVALAAVCFLSAIDGTDPDWAPLSNPIDRSQLPDRPDLRDLLPDLPNLPDIPGIDPPFLGN